MLTEYPTTWKDSADTLIDELPAVLAGNYAKLPKVVRALWNAQGYITGKLYSDKPDVTSAKTSLKAAGAKELSQDEFIERLKASRDCECAADGGDSGGMKAVDWKSLLLTIVQIILKLIG
jgi:hypothetical protein